MFHLEIYSHWLQTEIKIFLAWSWFGIFLSSSNITCNCWEVAAETVASCKGFAIACPLWNQRALK